MKREPTPRTRALPLLFARCAVLRTASGAVLLSCGALLPCVAQPSAPAVAPGALQAPRAGSAASASTPREEGVRWNALSPSQREALAPLEQDWRGIDAVRKQKWIALAARFKTLPPEERARITARMAEWAKLTPAERGQARLRFEEARQLPVPDRSERWRAYQALPTEQREQLAARAATAASAPRDAASKPPRSGRDKEAKFNVVPNPALAQPPRPVAPTLVQAAPGATTTVITRRPTPPPHQQTGMPKIATTPEFVNRSTLLPRRGPQAAAVTSAASAPAPTPASAMPTSAMTASERSAPAPAPALAPLAATPSSATSR
jgi:hypothetical protein